MFVVTRDKYLRRQSFDGILCVRLSGEGDLDLGRRPRRGALDWSDRLPERLSLAPDGQQLAVQVLRRGQLDLELFRLPGLEPDLPAGAPLP